MTKSNLHSKSGNKVLNDFIVGGVSAAISKTCVAPIERVKIILQVQANTKNLPAHKKYDGIIDCFVKVTQKQGFWSLWRGNLINVMRYFPTQALNFACKEKFKQYLNPYNRKEEPVKFFAGNVLSGSAAGATSLCVVYPLDFARTRLAADSGKEASREFIGFVDCLTKILKSDGPVGLYRGLPISLLGIVFYRGAYFGLYDTGHAFLFSSSKQDSFFKMWAFAQVTTTLANLFSYPLDTVRRRLMMQSGEANKAYTGTMDCFNKIYQKEGPRGFFKGGASNIIRSTGGALVLVFYSKIQTYMEL
ncbi:unnamed protein product [Moneuplotes crassus]|uniref:ADP/ATP translocase n=1 Tax=Euplotes crassus TaxID=5936 RepID=A0AAD2D0B4_EUPCR|nr:unnamed protein product [Moneuplotes crassus]